MIRLMGGGKGGESGRISTGCPMVAMFNKQGGVTLYIYIYIHICAG